MKEAAPRPTLTLGDAIGLIVGTIVGVGIFRTPSLVAANVDTAASALFAWLIGGIVSLLGALCYAELAAAYPHAGGDYHFLTRAYGGRLGFLFAWARLAVIQTGAIALLAFVLGDYAAALMPLGPQGPAIYAAATVVLLTIANVIGVRLGAAMQNVLTAVEITGILLVVGAGIALAGPGSVLDGGALRATPAMGLVMVFVLLTYGGWSEAAYLSAEVRDPSRNIVRALVLSLVAVTALYLLVNWAYIAGLGLAGVAASKAVAAELLGRAVGPRGAQFAAALIVVAAITSANAAIFTGARTAYALGRDFRIFAPLGRWDPRAATPVNALLVQGGIALALVGLGALTRQGFETMVEYTAPVFWLFLLLTGIGLFVLRWRDGGARRPFRVPLYPFTPLVFCATCTWLLYSSLAYTGLGALVGVAVLGVGVVLLVTGAPGRTPARATDGG
ncbi:MAG TPA: amino acid permease [Candidatus Tectomicrobia bacterium]|nr:amino acid permease [Candidatus Tectomicrobia bacterium]